MLVHGRKDLEKKSEISAVCAFHPQMDEMPRKLAQKIHIPIDPGSICPRTATPKHAHQK